MQAHLCGWTEITYVFICFTRKIQRCCCLEFQYRNHVKMFVLCCRQYLSATQGKCVYSKNFICSKCCEAAENLLKTKTQPSGCLAVIVSITEGNVCLVVIVGLCNNCCFSSLCVTCVCSWKRLIVWLLIQSSGWLPRAKICPSFSDCLLSYNSDIAKQIKSYNSQIDQ